VSKKGNPSLGSLRKNRSNARGSQSAKSLKKDPTEGMKDVEGRRTGLRADI
jgi:hypothetical protein